MMKTADFNDLKGFVLLSDFTCFYRLGATASSSASTKRADDESHAIKQLVENLSIKTGKA
jgi:hypothetical protein